MTRAAWALLAACSFAPRAGALGGDDAGSSGTPDAPAVDGRSIDAAPDAPPPAVTFVRAASAFAKPWNSSSSSLTVAVAADAGDVLAVYVTYDGHASLTGVDDDQGDTWSIVDTVTDTNNNQKATSAYAASVHGGATNVTAHFSQSVCCRIVLAEELHGADAVAPLDQHSERFQNSVGSGADAVQATQVTTTAAGELVFAGTSDGNATSGQTLEAGTGALLRVGITGTDDGGNAASSEDEPQPAIGSVTAEFSPTANGGTAITLVMAFRP